MIRFPDREIEKMTQSVLTFVLISLIVLALSWALTPLVKKLALRVGAVDKPDPRKVHKTLMPRMGGLAIFLAFTVGVLLWGGLSLRVIGLLISSAMIVALGIVDDIHSLSPRLKLLGQLLASVVLVSFGVYVKFLSNPLGEGMLDLGWLGVLVTIIWLVGITNAVNLIDGLDGLASGWSAISALTMALTSLLSGELWAGVLAVFLAMAALGFLKHNFHPASIFMGDTGSMFLGFALGALSIMSFSKGATVMTVFIPILILGVPIFDTSFAIFRRVRSHKPVFQADKGHLHHRLLSLGLSHRQTVLVIYGITLVFSALALLLTLLTTTQSIILLLIVLVLILLLANRLRHLPVPGDSTALKDAKNS